MDIRVGSDSTVKAVVVKFLFTNRNQIPLDIPEQVRLSDAQMDELHRKQAVESGQVSLAYKGRVRPGRVDTGIHFIDNEHQMQVGLLRRGLASVGYHLTEAHWYLKVGNPGKDTSDKFVVVLKFSATAGESVDISRRCVEGLRALANTTWGWCHGWSNPDGVVTLNMGGRQPGSRPNCAVVIRDRNLRVVPVAESVGEEGE